MEWNPCNCSICPRRCGADRTLSEGFCGASDIPEVSKIMLHHWEEPPVSGDPGGKGGSGAIFFSHCSLGCVYCQNGRISRRTSKGEVMPPVRLAEEMLKLQDSGAFNINFVSPTHYTPAIIEAVEKARKSGLTLPVVWNTGGYELAETIRNLEGTVDIFLTDFKYASSVLASELSAAGDYPGCAALSLRAMYDITGKCEFDGRGMMTRGTIVRHLVLPSHKDDSMKVLDIIKDTVPVEGIRLSLMAQYTPDFLPAEGENDRYKRIRRKITSYEYSKVSDYAEKLGFTGWMQERSSATSRFTPDF